MRISGVLIAAISAPVLLLTACTTESAEPVRGTVIDKEHEEAVYGTREVPIKSCTTTTRKSRTKKTCVTTGTTTKPYLKKKACYELDIRVSTEKVAEVCDKDAYFALNVGDRYSSKTDYSEVDR